MHMQRKTTGLMPDRSGFKLMRETRLWGQATGKKHVVLVHILQVDFNPHQLKRWNTSGCAVHVYVTAVLSV